MPVDGAFVRVQNPAHELGVLLLGVVARDKRCIECARRFLYGRERTAPSDDILNVGESPFRYVVVEVLACLGVHRRQPAVFRPVHASVGGLPDLRFHPEVEDAAQPVCFLEPEQVGVAGVAQAGAAQKKAPAYLAAVRRLESSEFAGVDHILE